MATLDLKSVAGGEAEAWVRQSLARDIDLGFELEPAPVEGDAFLLREALANLVHNAIQYSARGGMSRCAPAGATGMHVLEVEDDGPGIAPAEREPRPRALLPRARTPGTGSGLGLAIVREIAAGHAAHLHRGRFGSGGCRVEITFPHG